MHIRRQLESACGMYHYLPAAARKDVQQFLMILGQPMSSTLETWVTSTFKPKHVLWDLFKVLGT